MPDSERPSGPATRNPVDPVQRPVQIYAALLNEKKIVPSSATPYFAVERHFLHVLMAAYLERVQVDEAWYAVRYPDVQAAVDSGAIPDCRSHYVRFGFFEHRQPHAIPVDETWYLDTYPDVREAIARKVYASAQAHFDAVGYGEGRLPYPGFTLTK